MRTDIVELIRKHFGDKVSQEILSNAISLVKEIEGDITQQLNIPVVKQRFEEHQIVVYKVKIPAVVKRELANGFYEVTDQVGTIVKVHRTDLEKADINVA